MNQEMNLLFVKSTGHVLAAFTRSGEPDKPEAAADAFLGDGFHLRGFGDIKYFKDSDDFNNADFPIPAAEIGIFRTAIDKVSFNSPLHYQLLNLDTTPALNSFGINTIQPPLAPILKAPKVTLNPAVAGPATALSIVFAKSGGDPVVQTFQINVPSPPASTQDVTVPAPSSLPSGEYYSLLFVPGYPLSALPFQMP